MSLHFFVGERKRGRGGVGGGGGNLGDKGV